MDQNSDCDEYEESIVLVELNGIIDSNLLLQEQTPTKILDIDSEKPILQLGHYFFSGEFEDTLGTVIAYEPINTENKGDNYKFVCKADKKLSMKRIFLQEREASKIDDIKDGDIKKVHSGILQDLTKLNAKENVDDSIMDCSDSLNEKDKQ